jgi:chromosome partitioning protein
MAGQAWRVAVIAGKGGVGKTTTVINLGAGLAAAGRRCLVVDCDPQGNLTSGLGLDPYARRRTLSDVLVGQVPALDAILETEMPGLDLLPSHPDLSAVESELPARVNAELRLRTALREGADSRYDVILFDTPPNFGFHTISALGAATSALVPLQMSAFALRGLKEVIRVIAAARRHLSPELELLGVVPTFVNNTRFSRDMLEALGEVSQVRVFRSEIGLTVKLQESALQGVPVQVSAPKSNAARAYTRLAEEIIESSGGRLGPAAAAARNGTAATTPAARNGVHHAAAPRPLDQWTTAAVEATVPAEDAPTMTVVEWEDVERAGAGVSAEPVVAPDADVAAIAAEAEATPEPEAEALDGPDADALREGLHLKVATFNAEPPPPVPATDADEPTAGGTIPEEAAQPAVSRPRFRLFRRDRAS